MGAELAEGGLVIGSLLSECQEEYGVRIIDQTARFPLRFSHPGLRIYQFLWETAVIRASIRSSFRRRLRAIGWQYSEIGWQHAKDEERWSAFAFAAPIQPVPVPEKVFHVTRRTIVPVICKEGLLPSSPAISATGRADCQGNIYFCLELGSPDASPDSEPGKSTATWWKWHFSRNNRFHDPNWTILSVRLQSLDATLYRDMWSSSGLIVDGIERVPPERIDVLPGE